MSRIWEKVNYRSGIQFLIDYPIREYDITKANISVLRDTEVISEEQYQYFLQCPKLEREIAIGKMKGVNPSISSIEKEAISNARRIFIELNQIQDSEILEIRNDSICVIGNRPITNLQITSRVFFREDGRYTSYYHLGDLHLFYYANMIENAELLKIKGIGDLAYSLHHDYMIDLLKELFYTAQFEGVREAIPLLSTVYSNYNNLDMDINYYREFNSQSKFRLKDMSGFDTFYMDYAQPFHKPLIDISYNSNILRQLNSMFASVYFGR